MSLETALNRARYWHLNKIQEYAMKHYRRSGRDAYWRLFEKLHLELSALAPLCRFQG